MHRAVKVLRGDLSLKHIILKRKVTTLFVFILISFMGVLCFHWTDHHRHDALYHLNQYHERNQEVALRNEEDRRYRHEEYLEYGAKFLETAREHEHEYQKSLKRDDELVHENDETARENERNSRQMISADPKDAVIDKRSAKSFLKMLPKRQ